MNLCLQYRLLVISFWFTILCIPFMYKMAYITLISLTRRRHKQKFDCAPTSSNVTLFQPILVYCITPLCTWLPSETRTSCVWKSQIVPAIFFVQNSRNLYCNCALLSLLWVLYVIPLTIILLCKIIHCLLSKMVSRDHPTLWFHGFHSFQLNDSLDVKLGW